MGATNLAVLAIGASIFSGVQQSRAIGAEATALARAATFNSQQELRAGAAEEARIRRGNRRTLASQEARFRGKSGVLLEGSPMMALAQNAAELEMDALNARFAGQGRAASAALVGRGRIRSAQTRSRAALALGAVSAFGIGSSLLRGP